MMVFKHYGNVLDSKKAFIPCDNDKRALSRTSKMIFREMSSSLATVLFLIDFLVGVVEER